MQLAKIFCTFSTNFSTNFFCTNFVRLCKFCKPPIFQVVAVGDDEEPVDSYCALTVKLPPEPSPEFLKPLKDLDVTEGEKAEFMVETNCKPRTVKWYKNGQEVKPDDRIEIKGEDTKYRLVIKEAKKDDAGQYKVVIENSAGQKDSEAKLTVRKPKPDQPRIVKGLEDQIVAKGDALIFEVKVEGEVTELRWLKDGQPAEKAVKATIEKIDDKT